MHHYDLHAFISYAHLDNEPLEPGQKGWVSRFHAALQTRLSQRLGERARIWRDEKLAGDDIFSDEIIARFAKSALLVSILTPRYVRSEWCNRELDKFVAAAAQNGGLQVGNKSRVVKVLKTPLVPGDKLPPLFERMLGHEFYTSEGERLHEIDPAFGESEREAFLRRVSDLAVEMAENLRGLGEAPIGDSSAGTAAAATPPSGLTVFVAQCGRDLQTIREQLVTDLRLHGHAVLPQQPLPLLEDELRQALADQLTRCALAVHLVGGSTGPVPEGPSGRSLVAIQNEAAAAQSAQGGLKRILWLAPDAKGERPEQQAYLDALQRDAALQQGADLLRGDLEALKSAVHQTLQRLRQPAPAPTPAVGEGAQVHLLMTEADRVAAVPLIKALRTLGLAVSVPVFTGEAAELRLQNAQRLADSQAVLLVYGAGDEAWKFHQLTDLRKQAAAKDSVLPCWLLLALPLTPDKQVELALAEPRTIDLTTGPADAALAALAAALANPAHAA